MNPVKNINFDEAVIYLQLLKERTLLVVDAFTTLKYLDIQTLKIKNEVKMANLHSRYSTDVVAFSTTAEHLALISPNAKESRLYETKSKKLIATVDRHQGEVSCVGIDPKDRYMFSSADDGLTFGVDIKSAKLAFTLPRHIDTVNDIAFSENGQLVATASFDKNIFIFNLGTMAEKTKLKAHSAPVIKLQFLRDNRLFSIDQKGSAIIWDIDSSKVITRLKDIHDDITQVRVDNENRFLFLGTKLGYILVYDLKSYEQISPKYIKLKAKITALNFDEIDKQLIIATDSGEVLFYNIFENEDHLNELLRDKKYYLMQVCMDENPLLKYTKSSQIFDALWARTLQKAKEFLENRQQAKAIKLFENFKQIPKKKQIMNNLIQEYEEYDKFLGFISQKKLTLAYGLADAHPVYKESRAYLSMELQWKKTFALAQKYLLSPKTNEMAEEVLAPYRGISEKSKLIQDLLLNAQLHKRFRIAIGQKDFKSSFELVKQHPFLKECSEYKTLMKFADSLYIKAQTFVNSDDTHAAIKIFRTLLEFDDFKDEAKETILEIQNRQKFFNAVKEDDMILAYNLLDSSYELQQSRDGKRLEKLWEDDFNRANECTVEADISGVKSILEKYMNIKSKNMAIATVISLCYITQLNNALKEQREQKHIENGIKNYILYYGLTEQILSFFETFQQEYRETKLNLESQTQGSMGSWRPPMIVKSILD